MNAPALPWLVPRAAYVHVPFCAHHCGYCDFAVVTGRDQAMESYVEALTAEIAGLGQPQPIDTLFLGGGTPTHLPPHLLERLLTALDDWLPVLAGGEKTVEANPDTLTEEKLEVLARHAFNRVSLGAQSFFAPHLAMLERSHDPTAIAPAVERTRRIGAAVSLDLIFAVPSQTLPQWRQELACALELHPEHISTYGLTYEKGTRLWKQRRQGTLQAVVEEDELEMYRASIATLTGAGFDHYEISNFARPGFRSRHNQVYWANEAYHGFGLGAARYVQGVREVNRRDLDGYIHNALAGLPVTQSSEQLEPFERARETMAIQLRRCEGIQRRRFEEQTGFELDPLAGDALPNLVEMGLLSDDGASVALTLRGREVADGIIERLMQSAYLASQSNL
ncbi:MAG: radical SAM family heme chaperone HemW [Gemmataceae bacterium]